MIWSKIGAALAFYTCIPLPASWMQDFRGIACFAPIVGLFIGGLLGFLDQGFQLVGFSILVRSTILVALWLGITGGLHLDGAMDTADGLAVMDPDRRLEVMADSRTGAFGVMAAIVIILLKIVALTDLNQGRWLALMLAAGWGRWAQQVAIARYPYLKPTGKGAFHKDAIRSMRGTLPSLLLLLGLSTVPFWFWFLLPTYSPFLTPYPIVLLNLSGLAIALLVPAYFNHKLGGNTGDTYGAVVEWTEALVLVLQCLTR